ncbi:F-box family protein [Raphanus sativus]|uniref:F-box protein At1g30790-like n=1 Tax=Raphanus sativus TaxID=3726 RepID=A0A9W3CQR1_RAPSA|nr:F-box protein At1g30790-like [Raphanus sativus]KAJ4870809.1 F-box family protein [Raphanus sativus]
MEDSQPSLVQAGNSTTTTTTIPFDLIIQILSLLPGRSLIRFQSVSKLWFSTIRSKFFVDLFQTRSKTRPRLLFATYDRDSQKQFIFSAPEHIDNKDDDDKSSSSVMARCETISYPDYYMSYGSVEGFVCSRGLVHKTITVYNPTTRQVVRLPDLKPKGMRQMDARLGYDPVEDQYKVLCVTESQDIPQEHFVCTVSSSQKQEWRKIENPTGDDYQCICRDKCIDGALYYGVGRQTRIVRFDVRSEKIEFIKTPKESHIYRCTFINYKGKLGCLDYSFIENSMTLWVLKDAEKQKWSSMTCALPTKWEDLTAVHIVSIGVIHTGELVVFNPAFQSSKPFYVCYNDFNKESTRKVESTS